MTERNVNMSEESLAKLSRAEIQKIAKENGIKANQKTAVMIALLADLMNTHNERERLDNGDSVKSAAVPDATGNVSGDDDQKEHTGAAVQAAVENDVVAVNTQQVQDEDKAASGNDVVAVKTQQVQDEGKAASGNDGVGLKDQQLQDKDEETADTDDANAAESNASITTTDSVLGDGVTARPATVLKPNKRNQTKPSSKVPVRSVKAATILKVGPTTTPKSTAKPRKKIDWDAIHAKGFSKMKSIDQYSTKAGPKPVAKTTAKLAITKRSSPRLAEQKMKGIVQQAGLTGKRAMIPRPVQASPRVPAAKAAKTNTLATGATAVGGTNVADRANAVRALAEKAESHLKNSPIGKKLSAATNRKSLLAVSRKPKGAKAGAGPGMRPLSAVVAVPEDKAAKVNKKQQKFDIKASLSRALPYTPHKGKLKPLAQINETREEPKAKTPSKVAIPKVKSSKTAPSEAKTPTKTAPSKAKTPSKTAPLKAKTPTKTAPSKAKTPSKTVPSEIKGSPKTAQSQADSPSKAKTPFESRDTKKATPLMPRNANAVEGPGVGGAARKKKRRLPVHEAETEAGPRRSSRRRVAA